MCYYLHNKLNPYGVVKMTSNYMMELLDKQLSKTSTAMIYNDNGKEIKFGWDNVAEKVNLLSKFFIDKDMKTQDKVGIFADNSPEWSMVDFACLKTRMCSVPLYSSSTLSHLTHIIDDAEIKIIFVDNEEQFNMVNSIKNQCRSLKMIVPFNDLDNRFTLNKLFELYTRDEYKDLSSKLTEIEKSATAEDLATLIYTSGTTGMPKGVKLTKGNFSAALKAHEERIKITDKDRSLCFLPLGHIFERAWSYFIMLNGAENYYVANPQNIAQEIKLAKPTVMSSVPRFFEKVYNKVQIDLDKSTTAKINVFKWATRVGKKVLSRKSNHEFISPLLYLQHKIADHLVFSKFKESFGGRIRFFNCGGASLQDDVNLFFQSLSLPIIYGYGMTETLATVSCYTKNPVIGSVGKPMSGVQVKIDPSNNEILVKGDTVTKGYYNRPYDNETLFTEDGWLRTGDAGRIDIEGNLFYVDRIKEMMKTSNGKYVAPQNVESTIGQDKYIDQIAVIADGETFVSALIVPNYEALEEYAKETSISFKNKAELIDNEKIKEMFHERVNAIQETLQGFEKVKKFKLLEKPFSIDAGEITPTLKLKRKQIVEKYKHFINEFYGKTEKKEDHKDIDKKDK